MNAGEAALERLDQLTARNRLRQSPDLVEDVLRGVTVSWLAQVFGMDAKTVKRRLADCPPLHRRKSGYVYSLPHACRFLVKPAFSPEALLRTMSPAELPPMLNKAYWDAMQGRQRYEENAADLWRTESVRAVLSETFKTIKFSIQLWVDAVEADTAVTVEQRGVLQRLTDSLQNEIYGALVKQQQQKQTLSELGRGEHLDREPDLDDLF